MAKAHVAYRRSAIGISAGLGIALPLATYAATLPFEGINDAVRMDAMPFAAGIVAGVGMLTLTGHLLDRHAERRTFEEAEAAQFSSLFAESDAVVARTACNTSHDAQNAPYGKRFANASTPKGVPVISRAVDAMDEAEAWAEIDAFANNSSISCDPAHCKDVYQIALEELRRSESSNAQNTAAPKDADASQEANDRNAAMTALYGASVASVPMGAAAVAVKPVSPHPNAPAVRSEHVGASEKPNAAELEVPMADYSGHEDMWARALAILDESVDMPTGDNLRSMSASSIETRFATSSKMVSGRATQLDNHVDQMVEEEFERATARSVRQNSHDYLKVIEGGTASMRALTAIEA